MTKDQARRRIKAQKALLDQVEKSMAATAVFDRLEQLASFMMSKNILMYHSLPDELHTHSFLEKWKGMKNFFLPRVNGVNLDILPYDSTRLQLGAFHIEEPVGDTVTPVSDIDMVIVPAVAYDRQCNRVGRGRGFYDRLLRDTRAVKVGVAYHFQVIDEGIDTDPHDVPVDIVITDRAVYRRLPSERR